MSLLLAGLIIKGAWFIVGIVLAIILIKNQHRVFKSFFDVEEELKKDNKSVALVIAAFIIGVFIFFGLIL